MEQDQDVKERLAAYLKELHLPAFRTSYQELARQAQQEGLSFEQYLLGLAQRECQERRNKRVEQKHAELGSMEVRAPDTLLMSFIDNEWR